MGVKIGDLKKADLQAELDKRGLEKTGLKSVLIDRLKSALEEEGKDPEEYEFENNTSDSSQSRTKRENGAGDEEDMDTTEGNFKYNFDKSLDNDEREDTPCSDEELDEYSKHKEDTESARFKTWTQRQDVPIVDESAETDNSEATKGEGTDEPAKESSTNEEAVGGDEAADAKSGKSKVLKVIGKDKVQQVALTARTLWVTGLVSTSKVSDLKNLFSKHGKVTSAKIVRSTKGTQRKWYGLLTMTTSKDASKCIEKLHRTEFGGHIISVERRQITPIVKKSEPSAVKKLASKSEAKDNSDAKADGSEKKTPASEEKEPADGEEKGKSGERRRSAERGYRSYDNKSYYRGRFTRGSFRRPFGGGYRGRGTSFRGRFNNFRRPYGRQPTFERSSFRPFNRGGGGGGYHYERGGNERDFITREDRMREEEMFRHKMIVRKQKEEAYRLEKEKNQLRFERELLEREKAEMLKMERAKQRMEREQIEMEREKLRRHAEMRDAPSSKRPFNRRGGGPPHVRREPPYDSPVKREAPPYEGPSTSFHREKFSGESKFDYPRDHSNYKKPNFGHDDFRREKMDMPPSKYAKREERREVTYHSGQERRVYSRNEFRGGPPQGPSFSPREGPHFQPRGKPVREDWKFHEYRSGDKPGYAPRGRKMGGYY